MAAFRRACRWERVILSAEGGEERQKEKKEDRRELRRDRERLSQRQKEREEQREREYERKTWERKSKLAVLHLKTGHYWSPGGALAVANIVVSLPFPAVNIAS